MIAQFLDAAALKPPEMIGTVRWSFVVEAAEAVLGSELSDLVAIDRAQRLPTSAA
jgi:hypothetical protein